MNPSRTASPQRPFQVAGLLAIAAAMAGNTFAQSVPNVPVSSASRVDDRVVPRALMGRSVALQDDVLVAGYGGSFGGADVFRRSTSGWTYDGSIFVGGVTTEDDGYSVSIDGDRIAIGAPWSDGALGFEEDVAIWERQGSSWVSIGQLGQSLAGRFGESVGISGDAVIVGAPQAGFGRIAIYEYTGSAWNLQLSSATPTRSGSSTGLGLSVAIDGDVAVAGAPLHPNEQLLVFRRQGGVWNLSQTLSVSDFGSLQQRGYTSVGARVCLDGTTMLVTAVGPPAVPDTATPVVCVLEDMGSGFQFQYSIQGHDSIREDAFGTSIAIEGDSALISSVAHGPDGAVYLFTRDGMGVLVEDVKFVPTGQGTGPLGAHFGSAVDISGDSVVIAAERDNSAVGNGYGTVYVVDRITSPSSIKALCSGNGGLSPGCMDCPCSNNAPASSIGGCLNSEGIGAVLSMVGEARSSNDTMRLEVTHARSNSVAILFSGPVVLPTDLSNSPCSPGTGVLSAHHDGLRCVGGGIQRHGARSTDANGNAGDANNGWGGPFAPVGGIVAQGGFVTGQNRFFQVAYRDQHSLSCGTGVNTSNAIAAMVIP